MGRRGQSRDLLELHVFGDDVEDLLACFAGIGQNAVHCLREVLHMDMRAPCFWAHDGDLTTSGGLVNVLVDDEIESQFRGYTVSSAQPQDGDVDVAALTEEIVFRLNLGFAVEGDWVYGRGFGGDAPGVTAVHAAG
ncbi:hypothetical protein ADK75_07545 [Streptomyces virginiae]|uniref:Uncharacterized protein n=1 Tax=Streptomyces virginiae TaxID=1961 RepID=A0A0L8N1J6_STRVG|nr:hypothetical protein ADK75_07545 [Streptomyces virginiae]